MEMHQIRYFLAVKDVLNFTRAAERCNVSQPALTKAILKLEEELGGQLFRRERNQTHCTELGRLMTPHLQQTLEAANAAREQAENFQNLKDAPLRLGMMCTIGPSRLLNFFVNLHQALPGVEVILKEEAGHALVDSMLAGELDLAMVGLPKLPERFDSHFLFSERYVVTFAPGHRFETMESVPVQELVNEDYLVRANCEFPDHLEAAIGNGEVKVKVVYEAEREDWIQALVAAGLGCSVMPESLLMIPGIMTKSMVEPVLERDVKLTWVAGRRFSPAVKSFINLVKSYDWGEPSKAAT